MPKRKTSRPSAHLCWAILAAGWIFACRLGPPPGPGANATATLIPPDASEPAAGICAGPGTDDTVFITINVDMPDPRCLQIFSRQTLAVRNHTDAPITARLGPHEVVVSPGEEGALPGPVGRYLAPGVHRLSVTPYSGSELVVLAQEP